MKESYRFKSVRFKRLKKRMLVQKTQISVGLYQTMEMHTVMIKAKRNKEAHLAMKVLQYTAEYNVFAIETQHTEQPEFLNDTSLMENVDSNTTHDSSNMCNNEFEDNQNADDHEDECVVLANLIANLKLDIDQNKMIQKQLRKANEALTHELKECKYDIEVSNDIRDRCKSALHHKEVELEKYTKYKNCQLEKEEIGRKYKETLDLLAQQNINLMKL
ncbi:hypothetical protein Tco_0533300 [Tanacetum coccineum]